MFSSFSISFFLVFFLKSLSSIVEKLLYTYIIPGMEEPMRETWVWSQGREDPLEKELATHSSILAWRIP